MIGRSKSRRDEGAVFRLLLSMDGSLGFVLVSPWP